MTRRRKPSDPALLAAQRIARKRVVDDLKARGVEVNHDEQFRIIGAHRPDVFRVMLSRKAITDTQFNAFRRLEHTHALAHGHERPEQTMDRVQSSTAGAPGQNVTQAMIDAADELKIIYATMGALNAKIAQGLMASADWRTVIRIHSREVNEQSQSAVLRSVGENLALAWRRMDYAARNTTSCVA